MYDYPGIRPYLVEVVPSDEDSSDAFILGAERQPAVRDVDRALANVAAIHRDRQRAIDDPVGMRGQVDDQLRVARRAAAVLRAGADAADRAIEEATETVEDAAAALGLGPGMPDHVTFADE